MRGKLLMNYLMVLERDIAMRIYSKALCRSLLAVQTKRDAKKVDAPEL
jgi:hypothetical protein